MTLNSMIEITDFSDVTKWSEFVYDHPQWEHISNTRDGGSL